MRSCSITTSLCLEYEPVLKDGSPVTSLWRAGQFNVLRLPDVAFKATTRGVLFVILIVTEEKKRSPEKADAGSFRKHDLNDKEE